MTPQIQTPVPHEQRGAKRGPKLGSKRPEITDEQVREVRRLLSLGMSYSYIRKKTLVSESRICQIAAETPGQVRNRLTWSANRNGRCATCNSPKVRGDYESRCVLCDAKAEAERRLAKYRNEIKAKGVL
jgi:hypothetical protein